MKGEEIPDCCLHTYKMLYIYIYIYVYMQDEMQRWADAYIVALCLIIM